MINFESEHFRHLRACNFKVRSLIWPEIKLIRAFMPALVTSNFNDDSIKNERASMETPFSNYKSMGNVSDAQGQLTPLFDLAEIRTRPKFYAYPRYLQV